jgi:GNAT superfamily N-acetyltransferase
MTTPSSSDVTLRDLHGIQDGPLLEHFYRDVLVPYFDADVLVSVSDLHHALLTEASDTDIVVAVDAGGTVVGGAVGDWDPESRVYLLSYLAVGATLRSKGVGALLMEHVRSWWEKRGACVALAEVDDPRHHQASEHGDPVARLRFYERCGAQVLGVAYTQPEVQAGLGRVHGMLLLTFVVGAEARQGDGIRTDVLRRFLGGYLALAEGVAPEDLDAAIDSLVPGLRDRDAVPILPMSRYVDIRRRCAYSTDSTKVTLRTRPLQPCCWSPTVVGEQPRGA